MSSKLLLYGAAAWVLYQLFIKSDDGVSSSPPNSLLDLKYSTTGGVRPRPTLYG